MCSGPKSANKFRVLAFPSGRSAPLVSRGQLPVSLTQTNNRAIGRPTVVCTRTGDRRPFQLSPSNCRGRYKPPATADSCDVYELIIIIFPSRLRPFTGSRYSVLYGPVSLHALSRIAPVAARPIAVRDDSRRRARRSKSAAKRFRHARA